MPNEYSTDTRAYDGSVDGGFFGPLGVSWNACPGSGEASVYKVFADIPGVTFASDCIPFYALVRNADHSFVLSRSITDLSI